MRTPTRLAAICALVMPMLLGVSTVAHAEAAPGCSDTYQLGGTRAIDIGGQRAASVKQFWSPRCQRNFAYVYVWQSFRDSHPGAQWTVYVDVYFHGGESGGAKYYPPSRGTDFWSDGYAGRGTCTDAHAIIAFAGVEYEGFTDLHCG